jgi:hypothetical protein
MKEQLEVKLEETNEAKVSFAVLKTEVKQENLKGQSTLQDFLEDHLQQRI